MVAAVVLGVPGKAAPPDARLVLPGRLQLNLPWFMLYPVFFTMTGGREASDKYHKQGEKSREPHQPCSAGAGKVNKKPASPGAAPREAGLVHA